MHNLGKLAQSVHEAIGRVKKITPANRSNQYDLKGF